MVNDRRVVVMILHGAYGSLRKMSILIYSTPHTGVFQNNNKLIMQGSMSHTIQGEMVNKVFASTGHVLEIRKIVPSCD